MAFGTPTRLDDNSSKAAGTTVVLTLEAACPAGSIIVVGCSWDNLATVDGATTQITVTDTDGNTYTRIAEVSETEAGAADDGTLGALFYTQPLAVQLDIGDTITITNSNSETARAAGALCCSVGAGSTVAIEAFVVAADGGNTDPASLTIPSGGGSMTSQEYLLVDFIAQENNSSLTITWDADYTQIAAAGTTGGATASNQYAAMATRVATLTTDTVDIANSSDVGAHVHILAAIYEIAAGAPAGPAVGSLSLLGVGR